MDGGGSGGNGDTDPVKIPKEEKKEFEDIMAGIDTDLFMDDAFSSFPDFPSLPSPPRHHEQHLEVPTKNLSSSDPVLSPSSSSSSSWTFLSAPAAVESAEPHFYDSLLLENDIGLWEPNALSVDGASKEKGEDGEVGLSEELGEVFLEWLKNNRDAIAPEDLRNIRFKKSTIECAAKRLGDGKQGRMQLVKLILSWVQNNHLQKRRRTQLQLQQQVSGELSKNDVSPHPPVSTAPVSMAVPSVLCNVPANPNPNLDEVGFHKYNPWAYYPADDPMMVPNGVGGDQPGCYYLNSDAGDIGYNGQTQMAPDFHGFPQASTAYPPYPQTVQMQPPPQYPGGFLYQAPSLGRVSSATKEARKNRMARQKRHSSLHHTKSNAQLQHAATASTSGGSSSASSHVSSMNGTSLPSPSPAPSPQEVKSAATIAPPTDGPNVQPKRNVSASSEKQESGKSEKNLKFLLQKVLKHSDVGSLGRIVLPKREAESNLPGLDARDGISIPMEDIGTSKIWNMRYRYWPNNKSRMYLLENTGDFVRANGLQEGDFIVIYSDIKRNKYMIRGVKVRPRPYTKGSASNKSTGKSQQKKNGHENSTLNSSIFESSNNDAIKEELFGEGQAEDIASSIKIYA